MRWTLHQFVLAARISAPPEQIEERRFSAAAAFCGLL